MPLFALRVQVSFSGRGGRQKAKNGNQQIAGGLALLLKAFKPIRFMSIQLFEGIHVQLAQPLLQ